MSSSRIGIIIAGLCLVAAANVRGEIQVNQFDVALYGRWWTVTSYWVQDDLLVFPDDNTFLEPEGLALSGGLLYASGDRQWYETDSRLAVYQVGSPGVISYQSYLPMTSSDPNGWGPDGLVFNTSGSGYGGGAGQLVSVERDGAGEAGVIDLATGVVSSETVITAAEDVAFFDAATEFATVDAGGGPVAVRFYDDNLVANGSTMTAAPTTGGMAAVSASFASYLTRTTVSAESLLTVAKENPGNAIAMYDTLGNLIGSQQDLPVLPEARIPIGGGFYITKPAFGAIEAVTVDEAGRVIYIGDEENEMIHTLVPGCLLADLDCDGDVDLSDLGVLLSNYGVTSGAAPEDGDLDGDGDVDLSDLGILLAAYGSTD